MDKLAMETKDITNENIEKILELFPNVATEGVNDKGEIIRAIDFEKLKQELSHNVIDCEESYDFTWVGKKEAMLEANRPIRKTLRPDKESSLHWDTTENIYIEGDNLDALKLLQESYLGRVKMIYIDPPYNTGKDFVYRDNFTQDKESYEDELGIKDEEGNKLFQNTESNGRFHSDWCSMIYPRLKLARNLLSDDGVIFISIDDNEVANLTKISDEIFGQENKIALICHKSRASISNDKIISPNHNTILFYSKKIEIIEANRKRIGLDPILEGFDLDDNDGKGSYRLVPVDGPGGAKKGNPFYEFLGIEGYWRFSKATMQEKYNNNLVVKKGNSLYQKYYKTTAEQTRRTATTWWDDGGLISTATSKLKSLMNASTFDTPKPVDLINRMLKMISFGDKQAIILDFFSGSATTAHAVMQLNAEDGGNRKFIMVQLPEKTDEKSEAYKAGYKNICEIGKERIRKAGKKIQEENPGKKLDIGFRVFKVDDTNMKDVYYSPHEFKQDQLDLFESNIKENRSDEDLLYEVLLNSGVELSLPHKIEIIDGARVHFIQSEYSSTPDLIVCFEAKVPETLVRTIAQYKPTKVVFRDSCFRGDSNKINIEEIFKLITPDTRVKVL